ncbi:MAG: helix-turn-helix domain-containing protein [Candidatus Cryptobacteroides sp.]|nr:AraC family transcriptional regulator [Bacteroidales bacterium]MDD6052929.1 helix-turn-helix domain-containing protein [Bacteroidales bacterium]
MTDSSYSSQRIGLDYMLRHEKVSFSDRDILIIDSIGSFSRISTTMEMDMVLVIICDKGKLQLDHNGSSLSLAVNDMMICPPGVKLDNILSSPDFHAIMFGFTYEMFQKTICSTNDIWSLLLYATRNPVFKLSDHDMELARTYLRIVKLKMETERDFFFNEIMHALMKTVFYEMCVIINREIKPGESDEELGQSNQIFKKFIEAIANSGCRERSVAYFAQKLCISPKYLSFITRSVSGKPALEWILEYCTDGIAHELKYSDKTIKEISNEFNFPTISSFGKFVKKRLGMSPREYRMKNR